MAKLLTATDVEKRGAPASGREEIYDTGSPGLALRITSDGHRSFVWRGRIKGRPESIRVTIGPAVALKLKDARDMARDLYRQAQAGEDPREKWRTKKNESRYDFETVAEDFIREHVKKLRSASGTEAEIRRYLIKPWAKRSVTSITPDDVADVIRDIQKAGKPTMARTVLSHAKRLFRWAAAPGRARVRINPAAALSRRDLDIVTVKRQVILPPEQLALVWRAAESLPYPTGPYFIELMLSGQRRKEVSAMQYPELDLDRERVWVIPGERMKAGRPHEVPLSPAMVTHLKGLREMRGKGDYVFSTTDGKRPIGGFADMKADLDAKIAEIIKEDGLNITMAKWTIHDLRRTMRTNLGAIPAIPEDIRELVIAHIPGTLKQTYDLHDYRDEKRQALTLWADRLARIINPPPIGDNVVVMQAAQ